MTASELIVALQNLPENLKNADVFFNEEGNDIYVEAVLVDSCNEKARIELTGIVYGDGSYLGVNRRLFLKGFDPGPLPAPATKPID